MKVVFCGLPASHRQHRRWWLPLVSQRLRLSQSGSALSISVGLSRWVVRLSPALPTAPMPGRTFHSTSPPTLSPVWSRLARQPIRALRDASFAIPLPISQTLSPQSRLSPARCRWIPPFTQAALHRAAEANQTGWAALLPGGSMTRQADANAMQNGIGFPTTDRRNTPHKYFLSKTKSL